MAKANVKQRDKRVKSFTCEAVDHLLECQLIIVECNGQTRPMGRAQQSE